MSRTFSMVGGGAGGIQRLLDAVSDVLTDDQTPVKAAKRTTSPAPVIAPKLSAEREEQIRAGAQDGVRRFYDENNPRHREPGGKHFNISTASREQIELHLRLSGCTPRTASVSAELHYYAPERWPTDPDLRREFLGDRAAFLAYCSALRRDGVALPSTR